MAVERDEEDWEKSYREAYDKNPSLLSRVVEGYKHHSYMEDALRKLDTSALSIRPKELDVSPFLFDEVSHVDHTKALREHYEKMMRDSYKPEYVLDYPIVDPETFKTWKDAVPKPDEKVHMEVTLDITEFIEKVQADYNDMTCVVCLGADDYMNWLADNNILPQDFNNFKYANHWMDKHLQPYLFYDILYTPEFIKFRTKEELVEYQKLFGVRLRVDAVKGRVRTLTDENKTTERHKRWADPKSWTRTSDGKMVMGFDTAKEGTSSFTTDTVRSGMDTLRKAEEERETYAREFMSRSPGRGYGKTASISKSLEGKDYETYERMRREGKSPADMIREMGLEGMLIPPPMFDELEPPLKKEPVTKKDSLKDFMLRKFKK